LRLALVAIALLSAVGCGEEGSQCGVTSGVVSRVIDGDTIDLESGERIRYILVNAPEITSGKNDCYGQNAAQFNTDLVLGKTVSIRYDAECTDRFDRLLAFVSVDGTDVNKLLVERGYACVLHIPPAGDSRADEFEALEDAAKLANRGLWGECDPIPCN